MTQPPRKKPAKPGAKRVSQAVRRTKAKAGAVVATPRRQSAALVGTRDLAALVQRVEAIFEGRSRQLLTRVGKGYSARNLWYFLDFYVTYRGRTPKVRAEGYRTILVEDSKPADAAKILHEPGADLTEGFSSRLSWTHYRALLAVSDPAARAFYEVETSECFLHQTENGRMRVADGTTYQVEYSRLDVMISVGHRVRFHRGAQFRIRATAPRSPARPSVRGPRPQRTGPRGAHP